MLKTGQFPFLTTVMETLRRHAQTKPIEALRQKTLSIMRSLINKETISNAMAPFILKETVEHSVLTSFLISIRDLALASGSAVHATLHIEIKAKWEPHIASQMVSIADVYDAMRDTAVPA